MPPESPSRPASSAAVWIISGAFIGVAVILLVIGIIQFMDSSPVATEDAAISSDVDVVPDRPIAVASRNDLAGVTKKGATLPTAMGVEARRKEIRGRCWLKPAWVEPMDVETADTTLARPPPYAEAEARFLPDWARSPIPDRIDGPFVVVRRTFTGRATRSSCRHSTWPWISIVGGTIELADEGPLYVDDLRVARRQQVDPRAAGLSADRSSRGVERRKRYGPNAPCLFSMART